MKYHPSEPHFQLSKAPQSKPRKRRRTACLPVLPVGHLLLPEVALQAGVTFADEEEQGAVECRRLCLDRAVYLDIKREHSHFVRMRNGLATLPEQIEVAAQALNIGLYPYHFTSRLV